MNNDIFYENAIDDLKEYLGESFSDRNGSSELREKWNDWDGSTIDYYATAAGDSYLFDLAKWHSSGTLVRWGETVEEYSFGRVLDWGGGIGTYSLIAASSEPVSDVWYHDINESNKRFAEFRFNKYALIDKIHVGIPSDKVDTLIAIDVLEHMPNRILAIKEWSELIDDNGCMLLTYTPHTSDGMHPMHLMTREEVFIIHDYLSSGFNLISNTWPEVWVKV